MRTDILTNLKCFTSTPRNRLTWRGLRWEEAWARSLKHDT